MSKTKISQNKEFPLLSCIDQLKWILNNCSTAIVPVIKHNIKLYQFVINNTPKLCDNKNSIPYCVYWILDKNLSNNIQYKCQTCNKVLTYENWHNLKNGYSTYCSCKCAANSKNTKEKRKKTCLKNLGVEYPTQLKETIDKQKNTKYKNHGNPNYNNREQAVQTEKNKLLTDPLYFKKKTIQMKQTKKDRYGDPNWTNQDKIRKTHALNHNGIDHNFKDPQCIEKRRITWNNNYGCDHPSQNYKIRKKQKTKYVFNDINFDTAPEIAFYIYHIDHNINVIYKPNISFTYMYNGKQHKYFPDFIVNDTIYEIKGDHFFDKNGIMRNPFNSSQNGLYAAKQQCMIQNNVQILKSKDYKIYEIYVKETYGKEYLKQFKKK